MISLIKTEASDNSFSCHGGILLCRNLLDSVGLSSKLSKFLPKTKRNLFSGENKFEAMVLGFQAGNEHLDDWDDINEDPAYASVIKRCYGSKSLGDYLRSFSGAGLYHLQGKLIDLSLELRAQLGGSKDSFILDLDSTLHAQYGKKMEGVEYCYKKYLALDSIVAFDELGLQYWHDVRPGSTYTSNGSSQILHEILSRSIKLNRKQRIVVRADSGFDNAEFFNACRAKGAGFVCAGKKQEHLMEKVFCIKNWQKQNPESKDPIVAVGGRECEIGHISYHREGYSGSLRLVVIRAKKLQEEGIIFKKYQEYDYYCFITNMGAHEYSDVDLIKLYRGRGNGENFIKEQKYGFDLKHYPCLKLKANKAFGLIAAFAYTLMRFISLSSPSLKKTKAGIKKIHHFAKRIRRKWLHLPAQVLRHAGVVTFRFNGNHHKEILYWQNKIKTLQFEYS